ncbi:MAG: Adenylate cyclase [Labilithrix sp.]|nr:Adenylate cyclase [Labilithrix sp.]
MGPVVVTSHVRMASSPADVWPLLTDTDRTNRLLVGSAATYEPIAPGTKSAARFVGHTRIAGFAMAYEEAPFEWTQDRSFSVHRKMRGGVLRSYTYGITLDAREDGGTDVTVRLELAPRHWLLRPVVQAQAKRVVDGMADLAARIDAHLRDRAPSPYLEPASAPNAERLAAAERALGRRGLDARVVERLVALIRSGSDADLVRMRPFEIAERESLDGRELLRALLHAVTLGLVELRWALVCPSCRTANDEVASLSQLTAEGHCQLCDIRYGIELDRAVEATFRPHPSVRHVEAAMFCIGGPRRTPHVIVQANFGAGESRPLEVTAQEGRYRLFGRGGAVASLEVAAGADVTVHAKLSGDTITPADLRVAPGGRVTVENASAEPLHVKIERPGYATHAATAHIVTTMGEFRRLFSGDILKASTPLRVGHCALLFSDLTGSTALYTKAGDAAAFRLVDDHFDLMRKAIEAGGGTVVKTMGDAVMAAFAEPSACARAATRCLRDFEAFRAAHPHGADTGLKLGLFAGPVYVVTANGVLDYFGQTVNCASRVQHLAESGELMLEEHVYEALAEADQKELDVLERLEARVKGVEEPLRMVRTRLAGSRAPAP